MTLLENEMSVLATPRRENCEKVTRYPLIGFIGPVGSGKSTLANLLQKNWETPSYPIFVQEEKFEENPYLEEWYKNPKEQGLCFKSQIFFLTSKVEQLGELEKSLHTGSQIIDPSVEMDFIFALAQKKMGWMRDEEFEMYTKLFGVFREQGKILTPDVSIVVNADPDVIRKRIKERGRKYELLMLDSCPEYIDTVSSLVESFRAQCRSERVVIGIDSGKMDFVNTPQGKWSAIKEIGHWTGYYNRVKPELFNSDNTNIILPHFV